MSEASLTGGSSVSYTAAPGMAVTICCVEITSCNIYLLYFTQLMHMGLVNTFSMKAFLDLSEKSRLFIEKYFNLTKPLYFDFTHLVCRSAIDSE